MARTSTTRRCSGSMTSAAARSRWACCRWVAVAKGVSSTATTTRIDVAGRRADADGEFFYPPLQRLAQQYAKYKRMVGKSHVRSEDDVGMPLFTSETIMLILRSARAPSI
jgi:hypothetical protein